MVSDDARSQISWLKSTDWDFVSRAGSVDSVEVWS